MIPRWPFRRAAPAPAAVAVPADAPAWRLLPPLQRVLMPVEMVAPRERLTAALNSWRDPRFLEPLGHLFHEEAPGGSVDGLVTPTAGRASPGQAPELPGVRPPGGRRTLQRSLRRGHVPVLFPQRDVAAAGVAGAVEPPTPTELSEEAELTSAPRVLSAVEEIAAPTTAPTLAPALDHPAPFRPVVDHPDQPAHAELMATAGPEPAAAQTSDGTPIQAAAVEQADTDVGQVAEGARPLVGVPGEGPSTGSPGPGGDSPPPTSIQRRGEGAGPGAGPRAPVVSRSEPMPDVGPARLQDPPAGSPPAAASSGPAEVSRPVGSPGRSTEAVGSRGSGAVQRSETRTSSDPDPTPSPPEIGSRSDRGLLPPEIGTADPAPDPTPPPVALPSSVVTDPDAGRVEMRATVGSTEAPALATGPPPEPTTADVAIPVPAARLLTPQSAAAGEAPVVSRSVDLPGDVHVPPPPPDRSAVAEPAGSPPAPEVRAETSEDAPLVGRTAIGPEPAASGTSVPEPHREAQSSVRERAVDAPAVPPIARAGTDLDGDHTSAAGAGPVEVRPLAAESPTVSRIPADGPPDEVPAAGVGAGPLGTPVPTPATGGTGPRIGLPPEVVSWAQRTPDGAGSDPAGESSPAPAGPGLVRLRSSDPTSGLPPDPVQRTPFAAPSGDTVLPVRTGTPQIGALSDASTPRRRRLGLGEPLTGPLDLQRIAVPADSVQPSPHLSGAPGPTVERGADYTVLPIGPLPDGPLPAAEDGPSAMAPRGPAPAVARTLLGSGETGDGRPAVGEGLPPLPVVARVVPLLGTGPPIGGSLTQGTVSAGVEPAASAEKGSPWVLGGEPPPSAVPWEGEPGTVQRVPAGSPAQVPGAPSHPGPVLGNAARGPVGGAGFVPVPWNAAGGLTVARETAAHRGADAGEPVPPPAAVQHVRHEFVQRLDTPTSEPVAAPSAGPATSLAEPAAGPATSVAEPAPSAAGAAAAPSGAALDELVRRLYDPLSARLKDELRLDRERAGLVTDLRR